MQSMISWLIGLDNTKLTLYVQGIVYSGLIIRSMLDCFYRASLIHNYHSKAMKTETNKKQN